MSYVAGVDLGTTFSAAAIYGRDGLTTVDLDAQTVVLPSIVAVRADGQVLTGSRAERRLVVEPARVAVEFKRRLGDPTPLLLGGVPYGAEALSGLLLESIIEQVAEREGEHPAIVGLSHPANYADYKLGLLEEAARGAQISETVLVSEPVAAAVHYAQSERVEVGDLIAIYDLGGGTFDASVVRRTLGGFEVIGRPEGIDRFGGIDMDEAVLGHVRTVLGSDLSRLSVDEPAVVSALARLRQDCRGAKEALSGDADATIPVMLPGLHTDVRLTRAEFEDMIRPRIRETIGVLQRTMKSARVDSDQVTRVLLVGGSSRIPLVAEMVHEAIGVPVGLDVHPKLTTALGAALIAHDVLAGRDRMATERLAPHRTASEPAEAFVEETVDEPVQPLPPAPPPVEPSGVDGPKQPRTWSDRLHSGRTWGLAAAVLLLITVAAVGVLALRSDRSSTDTISVGNNVVLDHPNSVTSAVFSPDGAQVLTGSTDADARLWDLDGTSVVTMKNHAAPLSVVAFSPDGSQILTAGADGTAVLMDRGGAPIATLRGHSGEITSAVFSPDGAQVLTGSADADARLWDLDGTSVVTMKNHAAPLSVVAFSPDGSQILTAGADGTAVLMDRGGAPIATLRGHTGEITSAVFSPDGAQILTGSAEADARLWDLDGTSVVTMKNHAAPLSVVAFSPDGSQILTAGADGTAVLMDRGGAPIATLRGHTGEITSAVFSPDGAQVLTGSADADARLWDLDGTPLALLEAHAAPVTTAVLSPDGSLIITGSDDTTARLWETPDV